MLFREKVVSSAIYIPYLGPWYLTGGLLKLFLLAVQSSAFVLKINLGDNFTPGRAFSNLSVCCLGRVLLLPPMCSTESTPESSFV